jgi:hypothetical protein
MMLPSPRVALIAATCMALSGRWFLTFTVNMYAVGRAAVLSTPLGRC